MHNFAKLCIYVSPSLVPEDDGIRKEYFLHDPQPLPTGVFAYELHNLPPGFDEIQALQQSFFGIRLFDLLKIHGLHAVKP